MKTEWIIKNPKRSTILTIKFQIKNLKYCIIMYVSSILFIFFLKIFKFSEININFRMVIQLLFVFIPITLINLFLLVMPYVIKFDSLGIHIFEPSLSRINGFSIDHLYEWKLLNNITMYQENNNYFIKFIFKNKEKIIKFPKSKSNKIEKIISTYKNDV